MKVKILLAVIVSVIIMPLVNMAIEYAWYFISWGDDYDFPNIYTAPNILHFIILSGLIIGIFSTISQYASQLTLIFKILITCFSVSVINVFKNLPYDLDPLTSGIVEFENWFSHTIFNSLIISIQCFIVIYLIRKSTSLFKVKYTLIIIGCLSLLLLINQKYYNTLFQLFHGFSINTTKEKLRTNFIINDESKIPSDIYVVYGVENGLKSTMYTGYKNYNFIKGDVQPLEENVTWGSVQASFLYKERKIYYEFRQCITTTQNFSWYKYPKNIFIYHYFTNEYSPKINKSNLSEEEIIEKVKHVIERY